MRIIWKYYAYWLGARELCEVSDWRVDIDNITTVLNKYQIITFFIKLPLLYYIYRCFSNLFRAVAAFCFRVFFSLLIFVYMISQSWQIDGFCSLNAKIMLLPKKQQDTKSKEIAIMNNTRFIANHCQFLYRELACMINYLNIVTMLIYIKTAQTENNGCLKF